MKSRASTLLKKHLILLKATYLVHINNITLSFLIFLFSDTTVRLAKRLVTSKEEQDDIPIIEMSSVRSFWASKPITDSKVTSIPPVLLPSGKNQSNFTSTTKNATKQLIKAVGPTCFGLWIEEHDPWLLVEWVQGKSIISSIQWWLSISFMPL